MDTILLIVTALSLATAAGTGILLARVLREERRRSDARVTLLTALAGEPPAPTKTMAPSTAHRAVLEAVPIHRDNAEPRYSDLDLRPAAPRSSVTADLFQEREEPSAWPRRLAAGGAMGVLIATLGFGWSAVRDDPPAARAATPTAQPLELLSLAHQQEAGSITISGLVQNPRAGSALSRVEATLLVFGADGSVLTSGRAPIDIVTLAPGDESPFVIRVPVVAPAARYRVGFRGANDEPLGHVDRRNPDALARKEAP